MTPKRQTAFALVALWILLVAGGSAALGGDAQLVDAAKQGDWATVRSLVNQRGDVNVRQPDGTTALLWAVYRSNLAITDLLVAAGADVNAATEYGETPLSLACQSGNAGLVERLLKAGANPNAAKSSGETVLMTAVRAGDVDVVKALIAHHADVNARETLMSQTPLMWAVARKHLSVVGALIEAGADVRATARSGSTPLHFAVQQGDVAMTKVLLAAGADANATMTYRQIDNEIQPLAETFHGVTPLSLAVAICRADAPETAVFDTIYEPYASCATSEAVGGVLLDGGADPNAPDRSGVSLLHAAAQARMGNLVKSLLAHGATPNAQIPSTARRWDSLGVAGGRTLFALPVGATPFFVAAQTRELDIMRALVAAGADPQIPTDDKTTPLMAASGVADPVATRTSRLIARTPQVLEAVKFALEQGGDVNAVNASGQTALHGAASVRSTDVIQFLVDKGAKVDVIDGQGHTPLAIAQRDYEGLLKRDSVSTGVIEDRERAKSTVELLTRLSDNARAAIPERSATSSK